MGSSAKKSTRKSPTSTKGKAPSKVALKATSVKKPVQMSAESRGKLLPNKIKSLETVGLKPQGPTFLYCVTGKHVVSIPRDHIVSASATATIDLQSVSKKDARKASQAARDCAYKLSCSSRAASGPAEPEPTRKDVFVYPPWAWS